jgi:membrane protein
VRRQGSTIDRDGVQALFRALIFLGSIIGLIGPSATQPLLDNLGKLAPGPASSILGAAVKRIANSRGAAGISFIAGLAGAFNKPKRR